MKINNSKKKSWPVKGKGWNIWRTMIQNNHKINGNEKPTSFHNPTHPIYKAKKPKTFIKSKIKKILKTKNNRYPSTKSSDKHQIS